MSGTPVHDQAKSTLDCRVMPRGYFAPGFGASSMTLPCDLLPDFSTTPNLVESVFRAGDGSEKAFYRRADSRLPQAGGGRCAGEGTVSPTRLQ
uniref:Phage-related integrase n=1 Tax=Pseudomonas aeruginosa TaxID=287 RepID=A0A6H0JK03_PSEAI|nr:phage-related integrase [Pseudomonas aeruginosa]